MPEIRRIETTKILCLEGKGSRTELAPLYAALEAFLNRAKLAARGDRMAVLYGDPLTADESRLHYSAALELGGEATGDGEVTVVVQPSGRAACETHRGALADLRRTYEGLLGWLRGQGFKVSGPAREYYLEGGPGLNELQCVVEIQLPVEKADA